ncbi:MULTISPECIES: DUF4396 domain-containing protein [unclassified Streptomyces]|uniref:DUF4396 domain-containing protein n=1 Tax=unclassified Streptomyces TaxID=2593676 RepID=UPI001F0392B8|nr:MULTISPECIES: DUF4396 domain-containing protein [unclassified Streptomyces]MCH0564932.1 DUF4396 domain-containing protein [Streptomyces sp. MUM 2J]MCH0569933.1 DUF4396 domain-containing protein [Streptomyces sp. MUM 136J]
MHVASSGISGTTAEALMYVWFLLVVLSAVYVAYDAFTKNPELTVMKWGWVLVTLYIGPIGAALYVLSCKEPRPGAHERFVAPLWKQALGSTIHCVAGDATGIMAAAVIVSDIGLPPWGDSLTEYVVGFGFGLLVFQALFMRDMLGGSYLRAVRSTVFAEWLSMNCVMGAMVAVLVIIRSHVPGAGDASDVRFWATFSLAVLAGLAFAYPVNVWLVANHLKHGMGTVRVLGQGGEAVHEESAAAAPADGGMDMTESEVTREQKAAMATLTVVFLAAGVLLAGIFGHLD